MTPSPVPFGGELLQLATPRFMASRRLSRSHQCLSAWSFFSCNGEQDQIRLAIHASPVPFGVELLQLIWRTFGKSKHETLRHQCLSAWSFFSCHDDSASIPGVWRLSPVPFGVELLQLLGKIKEVAFRIAASPVPFGVELLQLCSSQSVMWK